MTSLTVPTLDFSKQEVGSKKIDLGEKSLEVESPKSVAYVVRRYLAARRSGSAKVKSMSEISGTTAKPWKQKGTGRARQGSKRSVQFVGGRTCHGPTPRSFDFAIPKKIVKKAVSDALRSKLTEQKLVLFSGFGSEVKTNKVNDALKKVKATSAAIIVNQGAEGDSLIKSARNLKNVKVKNINNLSVYDIVNFEYLIVDSKAFETQILNNL